MSLLNRPDYVKCVKYDKEGSRETWCDIDYGENPFFISIDHAALNGEQNGRLIICGECRHEIIKALSNGCVYV